MTTNEHGLTDDEAAHLADAFNRGPASTIGVVNHIKADAYEHGRAEGAAQVQALTEERNHWIGEAKRYERLYKSRDEDADRWFRQRNAARAQLQRVRALADEWAADFAGGFDIAAKTGRQMVHDLRAILDGGEG